MTDHPHPAEVQGLDDKDELLRVIFDSGPLGVAIIDVDFRFHLVNQRFCAMLGYEPDELTQLTFGDVTHPEDIQIGVEQTGKMFRDEIDQLHMVKRYIRKDGTPVWGRVTASYLRSADGTPLYGVAMIEDISRRKEAEGELRESEARWRTLAEHAPSHILMADLDGRILFINHTRPGVDQSEVVGRRLFELTLPAHHDTIAACLERVRSSGQADSYEASGLKEFDGGVWYGVQVGPLRRKNEVTGFVLAVTDITERKRTEAKLEHYQQMLRRLASEQSLAEERERRRLAAELHDRTVQALGLCKMKLGALGAATRSGDGASLLDDIRALVEESIKDCRNLLSELSPPLLYELGFWPAVEWLTDNLREQHGIACELTGDARDIRLAEDVQVVLFQSARELLINARKHSGATRVSVRLNERQGRTELTVEDNGRGFDPLTIGDAPSPEAGGFGLFHIRERLGLFDGELRIGSAPGRGSSLTISMPTES